MAEVTDNKHEGPQIKAETWFSLAVSAATITFIICCIAALWVFGESDPKEMVAKAQAFTPFGAALLAVVTFFTVAWRGVLNAQQLEHQAAQLRQQIRQNDANDDANLAKLLQEGAKLLAEKEKLPQVIAGISTLEILIKEPNAKYAVEAMDLLGDLLLETYSESRYERINRSAMRGLAEGAARGVQSRVEGRFVRPEATEPDPQYWEVFKGLRRLSFEGGTLTHESLEKMRPDIDYLLSVRIIKATVDPDDPIFNDCVFFDCKINNGRRAFFMNTFEKCDFSDAVILARESYIERSKLRERRNYYYPGMEPRDDAGRSLAGWFLTRAEFDELEDGDIPF